MSTEADSDGYGEKCPGFLQFLSQAHKIFTVKSLGEKGMSFLGLMRTKRLDLPPRCLAALDKCLWPSTDSVFANNCLKTLNGRHCTHFIQNLVMGLLMRSKVVVFVYKYSHIMKTGKS